MSLRVGFELRVILLPQLPDTGITGVCRYVWFKAFTKDFEFNSHQFCLAP